MTYFELSSHIYAVRYEEAIIILDSAKDDYISLIDDAAQYLSSIMTQSFTHDPINNAYVSSSGVHDEQVSSWVEFFLEQNYIVVALHEKRKLISSEPLQGGGLVNYQWDKKSGWFPFKNARFIDIIRAFIMLTRVNWRLKRHGINGVITLLNSLTVQKNVGKVPDKEAIDRLAYTVDAASLLYPKKTYCLAWASTFVALAHRSGWNNVQLVIGVQGKPFYAHAWAEVNGTVIHDDPVIAQVLAVVMSIPEKR